MVQSYLLIEERAPKVQPPFIRARCRLPDDAAGFLPPRLFTLDMFFFRLLFDRLEKHKLTREHKVHVILLRNLSGRLLDAIGLSCLAPLEHSFFGKDATQEHRWFGWEELMEELRRDGHPSVELNFPERAFMVLEGADPCLLAKIQTFFMITIIIGNLAMLVVASLPSYECSAIAHDFEGGSCGSRLQNFFMLAFSVEYIAKFLCCPFVRKELLKQEILLDLSTASARQAVFAEPPAGPWNRVVSFVFEPANLIDLISILPAWISVVVGAFLPPSSASFLRVLRITRIFRILRTGRYLEMLQILGRVLIECSQSLLVLIVFLVLVALISGMLLQQMEPTNPILDTVPQASYWIWAKLVNMKEIPNFKGEVSTVLGIVVFASVMTMRQVLWTLPIGPLKSAFDDVSKKARIQNDLKEELAYQLHKPEWAAWVTPKFASPAHVEVLQRPDTSHEWTLVAYSRMPTPILYPKPANCKLDIPLHWNSCIMSPFAEKPALSIRANWIPAYEGSDQLPEGSLHMSIEECKGLSSRSPMLWRCRIRLLTKYSGERVAGEGILESGAGPTRQAEFASGSMVFEVDWAMITGSQKLFRMGMRDKTHPQLAISEVLDDMKRTLSNQNVQIEAQEKLMTKKMHELGALEERVRKRLPVEAR